MASRAPDDDHGNEPPEPTAAALAAAVEAEAVAAEAEAAAAEAEAVAAAARARAIRLRCEAAGAVGIHDTSAGLVPRWWRRRPRRRAVAVAATITLVCAVFAANGYMMWHHRVTVQEKQRAAEFATAARQAVTTLMSLDFNKTGDDMLRIAEISTGRFRDRFPAVAAEMSKRLQQSKVVTTATVNDVAVESINGDSATVLVAATTAAKQPQGAQEPQAWHIALGLSRDDGQPKISSIEFVQ